MITDESIRAFAKKQGITLEQAKLRLLESSSPTVEDELSGSRSISPDTHAGKRSDMEDD
jgi:hypothetical protein